MSLADVIIYGNKNQLIQALRDQPPLNEVDEYGYTPLIQSAIVNDIEKGELLLKAGAEVDGTDLTGRTALHWTTDNKNLSFSKLLLKHKANPNHYHLGGQPLLVMPLLRNDKEMKDLLIKKGARLRFAQDFINAKLLGHRFELEGRIDIVDTNNTFVEMEFEGFYLEFNLAIAAKSIVDFFRNFGGRHLKAYFSALQTIVSRLHDANELISYQHYLTKIGRFDRKIDQLLDQDPLIIPIACDGHATNFIRYKNILVRCDRGVFGRDHAPIILYKIGKLNRLNQAFIKNLLYQRQTQRYIDERLPLELDLQEITHIPISTQVVGNCSWANVEAVVPAMLCLFLLEKKVPIEHAKKQALYFYDEWIKWDRNRALHFCLESFYHSKDPAIKASKAATLGAILFQQLNYDDPKFYEKADKITAILTLPQYHYILKSYLSVFAQDKDNIRFKKLVNFLDDMGIDAQDYINVI